jgi:hypothetical protein
MNEDDESGIPSLATVPPPAGEQDAYSAPTVVGERREDLLQLAREGGTEAARSGSPDAPRTEAPRPRQTDDERDRLASRRALSPLVAIGVLFLAAALALAGLTIR